MVYLQSAPHFALQPYIGQYIYTAFNTTELPGTRQTFLPYDIPAITFFFGPILVEHSREDAGGPISSQPKTIASYYVGLITTPFSFHFKPNEDVRALMIVFKAAGFRAFFRRDMAELTDQVPDFSQLIKASDGERILEQLAEAEDFVAQIRLCDAFFLKRLSCYYKTIQIAEACRQLITTNGIVKMKDLAYQTNMSLRTLERNFTENVGVSPKLFARFKRFHHALALMNRQRKESWAAIAYECGYYDQTHFIKEFKTFTNILPSAYSPSEYALYNQMILSKNFLSY